MVLRGTRLRFHLGINCGGTRAMGTGGDRAFSGDTSPVGWYVGSYLLRFVELDEVGNDDPNASFLVWENTIIVRADSLDEAFRKVESVGARHTEPYKGGPDGIPVQWLFEGITEILPIYEPLEDGAEIMWAEHDSVRLSELRGRSMSLEQIRDRFRKDKT